MTGTMLIKNIVAVLVFLLILVKLFKAGKTKEVKNILLYLVVKAEHMFGNGTGELKYAAVTSWVYEKLPSIVTLVFTEKELDRMIEESVIEMKRLLEEYEELDDEILWYYSN